MDDEFVDEVSRTVNACTVFLFFPFYWLCYSQIDGNLGTVAAGMKLNGTPNDLIQYVARLCTPHMRNYIDPIILQES